MTKSTCFGWLVVTNTCLSVVHMSDHREHTVLLSKGRVNIKEQNERIVYLCLLLRQSDNFNDFFKVSFRFSHHDCTITQMPNTPSSLTSSSPASPTHAFLTWQCFGNSSPFSQFLLHVQGRPIPHENNMPEANTRSVLGRFCNYYNWEKGKDFVKICHFIKCVGDGKELECVLDDMFRI